VGWEACVEMTATFALVAAAASETGLVGKNNEDAAYTGRWLFAVADGKGGHAAPGRGGRIGAGVRLGCRTRRTAAYGGGT